MISTAFQRCTVIVIAGEVYRSVPGRMVRRIHVEPDISHPYDPYFQIAVHSKLCFDSCHLLDIKRYRTINDHSVYCLWRSLGFYRFACSLLCLFASMYLVLYGADNGFEKNLYLPIQGISMIGIKKR